MYVLQHIVFFFHHLHFVILVFLLLLQLFATDIARTIVHHPRRGVDARYQRCGGKHRIPDDGHAHLSLKQLHEDMPLPCILHWKQNHFVVLHDIRKRRDGYRYYIADPASQLVAYTETEMRKCWLVTMQIALSYLEENKVLKVGQYMELTGLAHTTAANELRTFSRDASSGIVSVGRRPAVVYVKR